MEWLDLVTQAIESKSTSLLLRIQKSTYRSNIRECVQDGQITPLVEWGVLYIGGERLIIVSLTASDTALREE